MTLGIRKLIVFVLIAAIFLLANVWFVVKWLDENGVVGWAQHLRSEYLTGTTIAITLVLLILLVKPGKMSVAHSGIIRRCPICDHMLMGKDKYCSECGSKV